MLAFTLILIIMVEVNTTLVDPAPWYLQVVIAVLCFLLLLTVRMFEAIAIQFGMD